MVRYDRVEQLMDQVFTPSEKRFTILTDLDKSLEKWEQMLWTPLVLFQLCRLPI